MQEKIIVALKEQYTRDLRKQVVKSILRDEKDKTQNSYNIIDQIFSYIISELNWSISQNTNTWDDTPLKILTEVFPKIETTKWFSDKQLQIKTKEK